MKQTKTNQLPVNKLTSQQVKLRRTLLEVSHRQKLSHLGSCLSSLDIIAAVYSIKDKDDPFVLSNGHAGYALYTVLAGKKLITLDENCTYCVHPHRGELPSVTVSTGSLGQGLPIAAGIALADPQKTVYCLISDGETAEGSIWETLRLCADLPIPNLCIIVNANGWAAYDKVNLTKLKKRLTAFGLKLSECDGHNIDELKKMLKQFKKRSFSILFCRTTVNHFPFLDGLDAHYYVMTDNDYQLALTRLKNL